MTDQRQTPDPARLDQLGEEIDEVRERAEDEVLPGDDEPRFSDDGIYDGPGTDMNAPPG